MYFYRDLSSIFSRYEKFPIIALLGPRQSGKTTLAKHYFHKHRYVNLENPEFRAFAKEDPVRFLREFDNIHGIIIDEFQYVPELLSYIQVVSDEQQRPGYFILTGSQNFLVNQSITQSLAGRVGILTLLPLSLNEQKVNGFLHDIDQVIFEGSYPRLYEQKILPIDFYPSYIHTYIERDVRQIAHVGDLLTFQKLMRLCAARLGQLLNISDLATNLGMDQRIVKFWLSVLEASYIIFLLKPHYNNFNKRLTKTPKLYFYDTGLACSLLDIRSKKALALSPYRGHLFESLILSDFQKQYYNSGISPSTYFWRDQNGRIEVDCLIDHGGILTPIEIKSGETISGSFFVPIKQWCEIAQCPIDRAIIIYGGSHNQTWKVGKIISWQESLKLITMIDS